MSNLRLDQRACGVLLHPTSLPGPHGIGDLGPAAHDFLRWLQAAGQRIWQWLPATPIGPGDSPYQSISAFAGSPLMVALEPLVDAGWLDAGSLAHARDAAALRADRVVYADVVPWRMARLREAHAGFRAQAGAAAREAFAAWRAREAAWADDFVLFMALERAHGGHAWWDWAPPLRDRDPAALARARAEHADEIDFHAFVQWQFDAQLATLRAEATARGVALLGDLPIFVAHHSADVWARPELYALDAQRRTVVVAGVPPDDLGPEGQRWGNPIYRWDAMAAEGWTWWVARVRRLLAQADGFRIDHFRGFAGYYEIPGDRMDAKVGRWRTGPGRALFDAIRAALGDVPIVAEDLGFITPDVHALRKGLGLPGMKILQFAFGAHGDHEFLPHMWPRDAVAYTGTHDNATVLGWWREGTPAVRRHAAIYLGLAEGDAADAMAWQPDPPAGLAAAMLRAVYTSPADLAIVPMQDVLGLDAAERMNTPGTLGPHNWSWRLAPGPIDGGATRRLAELAAATGRGPGAPLGLRPSPPPPQAPQALTPAPAAAPGDRGA